ncbi:DUF2339 domain-containing protein [Metasolibacillus meyeri]|uniref:DUF2339 domain-containing protein n=1 Tax=Metasolibacillus meyeri TaxID=1071052 RepID=UPI000D30A02D|nr:DUF2339 domain-containing protein [Metasolibacillus meyeri]
MEREWQERIERLEQEVTQLQAEVARLKHNDGKAHVAINAEENPFKSMMNTKVKAVIKPLTEEASIETSEPPIATKPPVEKPIIETREPRKSFEERITAILPKLFMLILVLGILWGLKLASDFGFLSDIVKVLMAYVVSIAIGLYAWRLEKKKEAITAMVVSLYGGSFIIGILATAAGAILYEIFALMVALAIALLYIAYGIAISYFKGNQALTSFIAFTSLLLPYLLEYMNFEKVFILIYIIIIFGALQLVILQHQQQIALYIAMFFSLLAIQLIWFTQDNQTSYFAFSLIIVLALFLNSWWQLFKASEKWKVLQEGALFSISSFTLLLLNIVIFNKPYQIGYLFIVLALFTSLALIAYKKSERHVFDVAATIALLVTFNIVLTFDFAEGYDQLALVLAALAGIMLAIRLQAPLMKITYSVILFNLAFILYVTTTIRPFWHAENIAIIALIIGVIAAYIYGKVPKGEPTRFESWLAKYYVMDSISAAIILYIMLYLAKLDYAYISTAHHIPYVVFSLTALCMLVVLAMDNRWLGIFAPALLIVCYFTQSMALLTTGFMDNTHIALQLITRGIFIFVLISLLADLYKKGLIYQKWKKFIEKYIEVYIIVAMLITILHFMNVASYLYMIDIWAWGISVMMKTLLLFAAASIAILLGRKRQWKKVSAAGFILLLIAICKLIFFDLATLNLVIRAILFIVVGAAGMLLSGRLGRK